MLDFGRVYGSEALGLVDSCSGRVLVCGTGHTLWRDLEAAGFRGDGDFDVIAVNRAIQDLPCRIAHGYSNHSGMLRLWRECRDVRQQNIDRHYDGMVLHTNGENCRDAVKWPFPGTGTSSLNAVYLALCLGYEDIVVCGVPLDNGPHYYEPPWYETNFGAGHEEKFWRVAETKYFDGRVCWMR